MSCAVVLGKLSLLVPNNRRIIHHPSSIVKAATKAPTRHDTIDGELCFSADLVKHHLLTSSPYALILIQLHYIDQLHGHHHVSQESCHEAAAKAGVCSTRPRLRIWRTVRLVLSCLVFVFVLRYCFNPSRTVYATNLTHYTV